MRQFVYRANGRHKVPADIIGPELERIWEANDNRLTTDAVVNEARPEGAPLHPEFEWNDPVAAEAYRHQQARNLIRAVRVVNPETKEAGPIFVHVTVNEPKPAQFYQHVDVIVDRPDEYRSAKAEAHRKLLEAAASYQELKALAAGMARGDTELEKLNAILTALSTAQTVAEHLN